MMNNNKILTVSYGTFSCTLEGFEDSFGTMKAIAEYFRDLASDDRYFGAEPPQPDAEMLARIAEREVSRRVQAREEDGKIHLSAIEKSDVPSGAAVAALAAAPALAEAVAPDLSIDTNFVDRAPVDELSDGSTVTIEEIEEDAAEDVSATPEDATEDAVIATSEQAEGERDVAEETVAKQEEPEDAMAEEAAEDVAAPAEEDVAAPAATEEEIDLAAISATLQADEAEASAAEDAVDSPDIVPGQPDAEVEAFFAEGADLPVAEPKAQDDAPAPDSIAAKLQRIRAVVSRQEETREDSAYLEDEHAETDRDAGDLIAEARADIEDALDADDAASAPVAEHAEDDVSALMSSIESTPVDTVAEAMEEAEVDETEIDLSILAETETDADAPAEGIENLFDEGKAGDARVDEDASDDAVSAKADDAPVVTAPAHPRARVIKVKRADLEAAIAKGDLEEYDDEDEAVAPVAKDQAPALDDIAPAKSEETALSPEEEADLARELAELEADIEAEAEVQAPVKERMANAKAAAEDAAFESSAETDVEDEAHSAEAAEEDFDDDVYDDDISVAPSAKRASLPSIEDGDDAAMNRLLAETDHKMDEPESADRRDAFAHLRAAVAAKNADSTIDADGGADESAGAYREDLAEVVRPRRPQAKEAQTPRPSEQRPAPLKLVAEQRIDVEHPKMAGPVRPRRVAASAEIASSTGDDSFADFAADMGAHTLAEKLEAAAAYLSFVEGREQFSRPQLMTKVRQASGEDGFSREEGLRSFGQLLRAGKIEKIKGGRFTVSEDIGFRPDHRAAG